MAKVEVHIISAFTKDDKGGNPAGVVFNNGLTDEQKQFIAKEAKVPETVFIHRISENEYEFAYYTPNREIDFCGHATMAALSLLEFDSLRVTTKAMSLYAIKNDKLQIGVGVGNPWINRYPLDKDEILQSLGITEEDLDSRMPIELVYSGVEEVFIGIKDRETLLNIKPDFDLISKVSRRYRIVGYHVFSLDDEYDAVQRNFAPLYEIDEDVATGSASAGLAYYLHYYNIVSKDNMAFIQGVNLGEESIIYTQIREQVFIGGETNYLKKIEIEIL